jgi:hypothetical protein
MDQDGAWNLFFATGLPQAYLASLAPEPDEPQPEENTGPDPQ